MTQPRRQILSVHHTRRAARKRERELQQQLTTLMDVGFPGWARGVRVEKAGPFQWAVVATEHRGR